MTTEAERWWSGWVICAVCEHRHVAVCPLVDDEDEPASGQECPSCSSMACIVIDEESP